MTFAAQPASIPSPPPQDPRTRRYPMSIVTLARRLYGDGDAWTPTQIREYIAREFGDPAPALDTIRRWVLPAQAELQREQNRRCYHRRRNAAPTSGENCATSASDLGERMLELRRRGLSFTAIAAVLDLYHDVALSEHQVRDRMRKLGVQPVAAKSAAMRRHWAEKAGAVA